MEKNENYAKSIKNWLVVISSITFAVNLWFMSIIDQLWLVSFTYLASTGLTFYNFTPSSEEAKKRRKMMVEWAIAAVAIIVISMILSTKLGYLIGSVLLWLVKILFSVFTCLACIYTFQDDSDTLTNEEKAVSKIVRKKLNQKEKNKPYIQRNRNVEENTKTKKFLSKRKIDNMENKK